MKDATVVDVPDTFNIQNIIAMIAGVVLVGLGTGVLFYETKNMGVTTYNVGLISYKNN